MKIEKSVPLPKGRGNRIDYPFDKMEVGDSFVAEIETVRGSSFYYGSKNNKKFVTRKQKDGTYRCWRVE